MPEQTEEVDNPLNEGNATLMDGRRNKTQQKMKKIGNGRTCTRRETSLIIFRHMMSKEPFLSSASVVVTYLAVNK